MDIKESKVSGGVLMREYDFEETRPRVFKEKEKREMLSIKKASPSQKQIVTERVDDLPLLIAQMERIGLPELLDHSFPMHPNWQGLSLGWVATCGCCHILSQAEHCLNHVQPWAEKRLQLLHECASHPVVAFDFTDDRLSLVLEQLSDDAKRYAFMKGLFLKESCVFTS